MRVAERRAVGQRRRVGKRGGGVRPVVAERPGREPVAERRVGADRLVGDGGVELRPGGLAVELGFSGRQLKLDAIGSGIPTRVSKVRLPKMG